MGIELRMKLINQTGQFIAQLVTQELATKGLRFENLNPHQRLGLDELIVAIAKTIEVKLEQLLDTVITFRLELPP